MAPLQLCRLAYGRALRAPCDVRAPCDRSRQNRQPPVTMYRRRDSRCRRNDLVLRRVWLQPLACQLLAPDVNSATRAAADAAPAELRSAQPGSRAVRSEVRAPRTRATGAAVSYT